MKIGAPEPEREPRPAAVALQDVDLLRQALQPCQVDPDVLHALLAPAAVLALEPGLVRHPGPASPVPSLWLLRRGRMAIGTQDRKRRFVEARRATAGQWVDVFGALCTPPAWFNELRALGRCELLAIPVAEVLRVMATDDRAASAFSSLLATEALSLRDGFGQQRQLPLRARLAKRLLDATPANGGGPDPATWHMDIPKQHLAQQLGVSKEALSRMLRSFSDAGLIRVQGYAITVLDRDGLMAAGEAEVPRAPTRRFLA